MSDLLKPNAATNGAESVTRRLTGVLNHPLNRRKLGALAIATGVTATLSSRAMAQDGGSATPDAGASPVPPEYAEGTTDWPSFHGDLQGSRSAKNAAINAENVAQLEHAWTFTSPNAGGFGSFTSVPLAIGDAVYVQDASGSVFKFQRETGEQLWVREYSESLVGPNGIAAGYGMIFGSLSQKAGVFALDAETGEEVWSVKLAGILNESSLCAPAVYANTVYIGTTAGYDGTGNNGVYALDAQTGEAKWFFDTMTDNDWGNPSINSGAGVWYAPSFDEDGHIFFGTGNPGPWPGTEEYPNGSSRPGANLYSSSMVSVNGATGELNWYYQAIEHDLFDHDFQNTPIIATLDIGGTATTMAIGSGKRGVVIAANAETGEVSWETPVGVHQNDDLTEFPEGETEVYPGAAGGIQTPIAYSNGTVFVPVINYPSVFTPTSYGSAGGYETGTGAMVAINAADGSVTWETETPTMMIGGATVANDLVFGGGLDGLFRAFNTATGELVWTDQLSAGLNAPPAISGDMIFIAAGAPLMAPAEAASPVAGEEVDGGSLPEGGNVFVAYRLAGGN